MGLIPVLWNMDTNDFTSNGNPGLVPGLKATFDAGMATVKTVYPNGVILLEHDHFDGGVTFFDTVVYPQLAATGYRLVTVLECAGVADWTIYNSKVQPVVVPTGEDTRYTGKSADNGAAATPTVPLGLIFAAMLVAFSRL